MSARFALMLVLVPVLMVIALRRPLWGLYATMLMYYFRPGVWGTPGWWQPVFWITICTIVGWAVRSRNLQITPSLVTAGVLILMMVVSSVNAVKNPDLSHSATVVILKLVTVQFLVVQLVREPRDIMHFLWANVVFNLWTLKSVVVITLQSGDAARANVSAAQGGGANYLAMTFCMALPLLYYRYNFGTKKERKLALAIAPFLLFGIIGTGSRGGFLTLICVLAFLAVRSKKILKGIGMAVLIFAVFLVMTPQKKLDRYMTIFRGEGERGIAAQSRLDLWRAGWEMFTELPMTGVGHDNFQLLSAARVGYFAGDTPIKYDPALEGVKGYTGFVCHNTFVQALAEGGLICSVPFFLLFAMYFFNCYRVRRMRLEEPIKSELWQVSQIMEATMWAFIVSSLFGSHFKIDFLYWYFGAGTSLMLIAKRHSATVLFQDQQQAYQMKAKRLGVDAPVTGG